MADGGEAKEEFEMIAAGEGENDEVYCSLKRGGHGIIIQTLQDNLFDEIVGVLEGILMSDEFQSLQSAFFEKHSCEQHF